jgi:hypothetical protein
VNDDNWTRTHLSTVIDRPEYKLEVEELRNGEASMVFVHLSVHEWSRASLKRMLEEFALLRELIDVPLFAMSHNSDEKWQRFVSLFGFKHLCDVDDHRKIFISIKDNNNAERRSIH